LPQENMVAWDWIMLGLTTQPTALNSGHICAGNPVIHAQLLKLIEPHLTPAL
jgi:hypothetical protein